MLLLRNNNPNDLETANYCFKNCSDLSSNFKTFGKHYLANIWKNNTQDFPNLSTGLTPSSVLSLKPKLEALDSVIK